MQVTDVHEACRHRYDLLDECRVLLVHGLLHLLGHDHEAGQADADAMAAAEQKLLHTLGWEVHTPKYLCPCRSTACISQMHLEKASAAQ